MTISLSKRVWVSLLIVPILAGLISLGLKLPNLAGLTSSTPKPRPRAVIQNQIKKCKENFEQQNLFALTAIQPSLTIALSPLPNVHCVETVFTPQPIVVTKSSRAPPANCVSA